MRKIQAYSSRAFREKEILFASFDTETDGLGGPLLFITAHVLGESYCFEGPDMLRDFFAFLSQYPEPFVWFAHNAQYDWRPMIFHAIESGLDPRLSMRNDGDIYQITLPMPGGKVVMRDSLAVFPSSLEKFLKAFAPELPKLELDFSKTPFDPSNSEHRAYAIRDAHGLGVAMPRLDAMVREHFGVGIGHTTAGTAVKAWCATIPDGTYFGGSKWGAREMFVRQAYYGGLSFLTRNDLLEDGGNVVAETFDINSSYPAAMCDFGVPDGRMLTCRDYQKGLLGIYRARVKAPDDLIVPILPSRNEKGHMRWCRGVFDTVVTSQELIFAANHGYQVLKVFEGVAFEKRIFPFNDFIARCKAIRRQYKDKPEEGLAKLMQNSLYGKFGSRRERTKIFHPTCDDDMLGAQPLENLDYFWIRKELDPDMLCIPAWAVFITAHARLRLLQAIYSVGPENVICGDTDSMTILPGLGHLVDVGEEYGQFKLEKTWTRFRAVAPKVYAGRKSTGELGGAAKGLPKKVMAQHPEKWVELMETGSTVAETLSLASLRVAMQRGLTPAQILNRKSSSLDNSVNWELQGHQVRAKLRA